MMTTIWKEWTLSCMHHLPHLPDGHKCRRVHGHNYTVRVSVAGPVRQDGPYRGMVLDFAALDSIFQDYIHAKVDHNALNDVIPNPTSENVARWVWDVFEAWLPATVRLTRVEVNEKDTCGAVVEAEA